jgi:selenophosphate synthetase-related protein
MGCWSKEVLKSKLVAGVCMAIVPKNDIVTIGGT